jgi:BetI-type transcriptional repressor, C-terminal
LFSSLALFLEIVRHHEDLVAIRIDAEHVDFVPDFTGRVVRAATDNFDKPGMNRLILNLAAAASEATHPAHHYMNERYVAFRSITASVLIELQGRGEFPASGDPHAAAALIAAALDGLQLQWLYDDTVDVEGGLTYLLTTLGVKVPAQATAASMSAE